MLPITRLLPEPEKVTNLSGTQRNTTSKPDHISTCMGYLMHNNSLLLNNWGQCIEHFFHLHSLHPNRWNNYSIEHPKWKEGIISTFPDDKSELCRPCARWRVHYSNFCLDSRTMSQNVTLCKNLQEVNSKFHVHY